MGPFKSLNEVLEVEGLSQNVLNKICQQIISNNGTLSESASKESKPKLKRFKQLVTPVCDQKTVSRKKYSSQLLINTMQSFSFRK